jgi:hypothetical protein
VRHSEHRISFAPNRVKYFAVLLTLQRLKVSFKNYAALGFSGGLCRRQIEQLRDPPAWRFVLALI